MNDAIIFLSHSCYHVDGKGKLISYNTISLKDQVNNKSTINKNG